jgi:N-methylhydantoinase A/acetophenone carboxylase
VLGYLDEDYYFGGQMLLNKKKAEETIKSKIADPLGVSVEEAAILIRKIVDENMGTAIRKEIHLRGYDPRDFVLFAIGGGGPTHVAGYMGDIPTAVVFSVFSRFFRAWFIRDGCHAHLRKLTAFCFDGTRDPQVRHKLRRFQRCGRFAY